MGKRASPRVRGRTRVPQAVSPLTRTAPKKGALPGPWVGEGAGLGGAGRRDRTPRPGRTPGCRWFGEPREKFNPRLYHFHGVLGYICSLLNTAGTLSQVHV